MDENVLIKILQNIEKRLSNLEGDFHELSQKTVHNSFHLDIKNVQTLNLEELSYHLDKVDVKELSGTLNIGNTFPPQGKEKGLEIPRSQSINMSRAGEHETKKTNDPDSELSAVKDKNKEEETSEISVKINGKNVPYRLIDKQEKSQHETFLTSTFNIGDINIGTIEDASAVNFGNNFPTNFKSHKKLNQGFGNILGDQNDIHDILSSMKEKDVVEVFNESQDQQQPEWLGMLMKEQEKDTGENNFEEDLSQEGISEHE